LVVVDSNSGDGSSEYLHDNLDDSRATVLALADNVGFGRAANKGARLLDQPFLLLLNSDATMEPGGLARLVAALRSMPDLGVTAPLVLGRDGTTPQADAYGDFFTIRVLLSRVNRHPRDVIDPDWVSGVCMVLRRQAWDDVDGFDPEFVMYLEDVDLCFRLRRGGWGIRRVREARVEHLGGGSQPSNAERDRSYHDSLFTYLARSGYPRWLLTVLSPVHLTWQKAMRERRNQRSRRHP
jgi:GT2 family glycosyltransferase